MKQAVQSTRRCRLRSAKQPGAVRGAAACLCAALLLGGCLTPQARYTRSAQSGQSASRSKKSYLVPRDWDYRKQYRVPSDRLKTIISRYIGVPYRWGGASRRGMDCSGFVRTVFSELNNARLPRNSRSMSKLGKTVALRQARAGDLVFFRGGLFNRINHVGIYVGNNRFAHASSKKGVTYSSLARDYYRRRFVFVRRLF